MHPKLNVQRELKNEVICVCRQPAASTPFHFHSHLELFLVEEGEVDVWIGQKYKRLQSGELAVTLSYDPHHYEPIKEVTVTYLIVPLNLCTSFEGKTICDPFIKDTALFDAIKKCCNIIAQKRNALLTNGCVQVIFGLLLDKLQPTQRKLSVQASSATRSLLYLHEHFKERISLSSSASALGFTPSYLSRQFKESVGIGFNQYLTMLRLREAVLLLSKGNSVGFCAYESGFHSPRTFHRAFYNEFGCTPKEYVQKMHT